MGWISAHDRFQNGLQPFSFKVESTGNVTDKFCVRVPFEQDMLLCIDAGFLLAGANPCIAYLPLLIDKYAVVTTARFHYAFIETDLYLPPDCLGCYPLNFGELRCGNPQNKRL